MFTHFSRPRQKSLADMLYGIQASGDTRIPRGAAEPPKAVARGVLSSVMRAINDDSGGVRVWYAEQNSAELNE